MTFYNEAEQGAIAIISGIQGHFKLKRLGMDFEQHFNDDTPYITLDGFTPMANSKPIYNIF